MFEIRSSYFRDFTVQCGSRNRAVDKLQKIPQPHSACFFFAKKSGTFRCPTLYLVPLISPSKLACIESKALAKFLRVFSNSSSFSCNRRSISCLVWAKDKKTTLEFQPQEGAPMYQFQSKVVAFRQYVSNKFLKTYNVVAAVLGTFKSFHYF